MLNPRTIAPVVAGAIYGLSLVMFVDGILIAHKEQMATNRYSFSMWAPAIFATLGCLLMQTVSPAEMKEEERRAYSIFFISWLTIFASTIGALVIIYISYVGYQHKSSSIPGKTLLFYTCAAPISSSIIWWCRASNSNTVL